MPFAGDDLMTIELQGVSRGSRLAERIEKRLSGELRKVRASPVTALVSFLDENGPKGGRAHRCAITVTVPRRPTIRVEDVAEAQWSAFDQSFDRLKRHLAADRERVLKEARYPKKYYAAARLIEAGLEPESEVAARTKQKKGVRAS